MPGGPLVSSTDELLERCDFPAPGTSVDVGVSGGADSTALLILAVAAGCRVTAVHVDHGLRPGSATEADRVAATAARLGAAFRAVRVEVGDGADLEARARAARYDALGPDALVGHTLDDRAETVLLHLLRGAGAAGFAALRPPDPRRPLLRLRRAETVALCAAEGVDVFEDPSNDDPRFTRNRVRDELLPMADDITGRDTALLLVRTAELIAADDELLSGYAASIDPTDAREVAAAPVPLAARALRRWLAPTHGGYVPSSAEIARVLEVARGGAVATELTGGGRVERSGQRLRIVAGAVGVVDAPRQRRDR